MGVMRLTKHHGLGNDFLVALGGRAPTASLARQLCDRRRGIGADGLIVGAAPEEEGLDVTMKLRNADGSAAEMSGNGIRCLAQAVALDRGGNGASLLIGTDAGPRRVDVGPTDAEGTCEVAVDMGELAAGPPIPPEQRALLAGLVGREPLAATVDAGNPHLVVFVEDLDAVDALDLGVVGPRLQAGFPDGVNVEVVTARDGDLHLRVWERGVGRTEACGTGATAAAVIAHRHGLVDRAPAVHMPGGAVRVEVGGASARLVGPATFVARVEVRCG